VVRETQVLVQRHPREMARPVMIELVHDRAVLWLKGTHERFSLTIAELFDFARRHGREPLITFAELEQDRRQQMQSALP